MKTTRIDFEQAKVLSKFSLFLSKPKYILSCIRVLCSIKWVTS